MGFYMIFKVSSSMESITANYTFQSAYVVTITMFADETNGFETQI